MFTWINSNSVRSDEGFEVWSTGRFTQEYREGQRKIEVYIERLTHRDTACILIMESDAFARWDGDPPAVVLPQEEQRRMLANFIAALEFKGMRVLCKWLPDAPEAEFLKQGQRKWLMPDEAVQIAIAYAKERGLPFNEREVAVTYTKVGPEVGQRIVCSIVFGGHRPAPTIHVDALTGTASLPEP